MLLEVVDQKNKGVGKLELDKSIDDKVNKAVLYYALKAQKNNLRHGTVKTKTRSEVNRTNKKVFKQKGTGNARHGARSANIFVGGGNVFGPNPRSYFERLNKSLKSVSYHEAFKYLAQNNAIKVVDKFSFAKPSAKSAAAFLKSVGVSKALVILPQAETNACLSFRNLRDVKVIHDNNLNVYDLFRYENVVLTKAGFEQLKERYSL